MSKGPARLQLAPSLDDLADLAAAAFAGLPEEVSALVGEVVFRVDDFPSQEILEEMGIEDPFELTGLYQGIPFGQRSVLDPSPEPARIFLFRRPILDEWAERGDVTLADLISHVLVHEIGHHFGLSDDDISALEAAADL
jgi:predicted Zn-dependent protease with MMP-like domain